MLKFIAALLLFCSLGGFSASTRAEDEPAKLQLVAEEADYQPGVPLWVGVLFKLQPGWHIYWQNPGDSGTPPKIRWQLPKGFRVGTLHWPLPARLGKQPVIDYGYEGQVLLMTQVVSPLNSFGAAAISADVEYVVCREICVPGKAQLALDVPPIPGRGQHPSPSSPLFEAARKQLPRPVPDDWRVSARSTRKTLELTVEFTVRGTGTGQGATFFPLDPGVIDNAAPQTLSLGSGGFALAFAKSDLLGGPPRSLRGALDVPGLGVYNISVPVDTAPR